MKVYQCSLRLSANNVETKREKVTKAIRESAKISDILQLPVRLEFNLGPDLGRAKGTIYPDEVIKIHDEPDRLRLQRRDEDSSTYFDFMGFDWVDLIGVSITTTQK